MKYNYLEEMKNDILDYLRENYTIEELREKLEDRNEFESHLHDDLWVEDSVTGNASGSYTFSTYKAKEYVIDNIELLEEAHAEFGLDSETISTRFLNEEWEYFDVTIRCSLLYQALIKALDEIESEMEV